MLAKRSELVHGVAHRAGWRLVAYLVALLAVWFISVATSTVSGSGRLELIGLAQGLQYLLVVLAAALAGNDLIVTSRGRDAESAEFGFYERRWAVRQDMGGRVWWTCIWAGIAAMVLNVVILAAAEIVLGGTGATHIGEYLGWIGMGIAAGAVIGSFSALLAVAVSR